MKHRIIFNVHIKPGREKDFLEAFQPIRRLIAEGQPGLIAEQVCQSLDDPQRFTITSEWVNLESFQEWEKSPTHRQLALPLRDCWDEAKLQKYRVEIDCPGTARG
jgi:heme oxygenase (mycobilin-producing)